MNDEYRLARFALTQIEAINGVLGMVARDRRRVQALIQNAETPSLRRYLEEWLDATSVAEAEATEAASVDGENDNCNCDNESERIKTQQHNELQNSVKYVYYCCPQKCWEDPTLPFWYIFRHRPHCLRERHEQKIARHAKQRSRLAFGVPYQWVTEPKSCNPSGSLSELATNGRWDWDDCDHFYKGHVVTRKYSAKAWNALVQSATWSDASLFYHKMLVREATIIQSSLITPDNSSTTTPQSNFPTVNQIKAAPNTEIVYDIVFYGADMYESWAIRHARTAKGTLVLSLTTTTIGEDCSTENIDTDIPTNNNNNNLIIKGTIQMDPTMESLDVVPLGGTVEWIETQRFERIISTRPSANEPWSPSSCSVMFVTVTKPSPDDFGGGTAASVAGDCNSSRSAKMATGEVKIMRQRQASFLLLGDRMGSLGAKNNDAVSATEHFDKQVMEHYENNLCLWMHRHTVLPKDVIQRIGQFVCPPPILYLKEDDLVLDFDWSSCLRGPENDKISDDDGDGDDGDSDDEAHDYMCASCIMARPRRPQGR